MILETGLDYILRDPYFLDHCELFRVERGIAARESRWGIPSFEILPGHCRVGGSGFIPSVSFLFYVGKPEYSRGFVSFRWVGSGGLKRFVCSLCGNRFSTF